MLLAIKGFIIITRCVVMLHCLMKACVFIAQATGCGILASCPSSTGRGSCRGGVLGLADARRADAKVKIAVLAYPRISNFDDLDALKAEPSVDLQSCGPGECCRGDCDLVILPGSKATIADLSALRRAGWDADLAAHLRAWRKGLGLCGGYQMLGKAIHDPDGIEGPAQSVVGLVFSMLKR